MNIEMERAIGNETARVVVSIKKKGSRKAHVVLASGEHAHIPVELADGFLGKPLPDNFRLDKPKEGQLPKVKPISKAMPHLPKDVLSSLGFHE